MVKRSIEQDLRNKKFGVRNGNYERNAVVKNQGTKQRGHRILGDCWQWESNGYKLRIRESGKLKTVLELYVLEIHQKKLEPDYHRLKVMVKRSIEQDIRKNIMGSEMKFFRRTPWSRIREQNSVHKEFLEIVGNGKPTGNV